VNGEAGTIHLTADRMTAPPYLSLARVLRAFAVARGQSLPKFQPTQKIVGAVKLLGALLKNQKCENRAE
jgi:hypothetical protein